MFNNFVALLFVLASIISAAGAEPAVAKISVLASGKLLLNGNPTDLASIEAEFKRLQSQRGVVWYYREVAQKEPPPEAMLAIELVIKYRLPISMSSKPDFSDAIEANGRSVPRGP